MMDSIPPSTSKRLGLREPTGWFAAGNAFRKALGLLSDGAFRLFAYICLEADRRTGRFQATHKELATALGKSKRAIGTYVAELESKGVCALQPGKNQFAATIIELTDLYWPYHRADCRTESAEQQEYIKSIRENFLSFGCTNGHFGAADMASAREMYQRSIPLAVIEDAMIMGACRKYSSWLEGQALEPIQSFSYFSSLIDEIHEKPLPPGYSGHLLRKLKQLKQAWTESLKTTTTVHKRDGSEMFAQPIVR
jgi:hypothetical protein